jgi:hypothetical protein
MHANDNDYILQLRDMIARIHQEDVLPKSGAVSCLPVPR